MHVVQVIFESLVRLCHSSARSVFVITHDLAQLNQADHIMMLDKATIVEQGSFESLISAGGPFACLHKRISKVGTLFASPPFFLT